MKKSDMTKILLLAGGAFVIYELMKNSAANTTANTNNPANAINNLYGAGNSFYSDLSSLFG